MNRNLKYCMFGLSISSSYVCLHFNHSNTCFNFNKALNIINKVIVALVSHFLQTTLLFFNI